MARPCIAVAGVDGAVDQVVHQGRPDEGQGGLHLRQVYELAAPGPALMAQRRQDGERRVAGIGNVVGIVRAGSGRLAVGQARHVL
ncbi:hypothetical protein D9M70_613730 [compost metagenome]